MLKWIKYNWLPVLSVLLSVAAICLNSPRYQELGFDYTGVIAAVLSLLITILIGWNIYSLIDMKGLRLLFEEQIKALEHSTIIDNKKNTLIIFQSMADISCRNNDINSFLYYNVLSIRCAIESEQLDTANSLLTYIIQTSKGRKYSLYAGTKETLLVVLYKSKELYAENKEDINKVIQIVTNAKVVQPPEVGA